MCGSKDRIVQQFEDASLGLDDLLLLPRISDIEAIVYELDRYVALQIVREY